MRNLSISIILIIAITYFIPSLCQAQEARVSSIADMRDSGGPPIPEQQKYDVNFYDLNLRVDPDRKWIGGHLTMTATTVEELVVVVLHLDTLLQVSEVKMGRQHLQRANWERKGGLILVDSGSPIPQSREFSVRVDYAGHPLRVENPDEGPFGDGFYFESTSAGQHWVSLISVFTGADVWMPVKDHPSDEPDSMAIAITAPEALEVASNGRLQEITDNEDGTRTHHWFVSTPINTWGATVNIAPYRPIETEYESVTGDTFPFVFWALEEEYEEAKAFFPEMVGDLRYLEELLGPFPFRADKAGVVHTYYHGMENQSIIAYNQDYRRTRWGHTQTHLHELAHEWIGNMVTADWKDLWVHEGLVTYITALYVEGYTGIDAYRPYMDWRMNRITNEAPIIQPQEHATIRESFHSDVYEKGSVVLHTLRFLIGKEQLIQSLKTLAYPEEHLKTVTDGSHTRFTDLVEYRGIVEAIHGAELDWFFDAYLYHAMPPELHVREDGDRVTLVWETPSAHTFSLPVPVSINGSYRIVRMDDGIGTFDTEGTSYQIDPNREILRYQIPVDDLVYEVLDSQGIQAARAQYRTLRKEKPDSVRFGPPLLNRLGYSLLRDKCAEEAIAIFEMNVEAYPEQPNPYDSLGDAYSAVGRLKEARRSYGRAVEIAEEQGLPSAYYRSNLERVIQQLKEK